jgi:hypothetical protein
MSSRAFIIPYVLAVTLFAAGLAHADVPQLIGYQGYVIDTSSSPLEGVLELTFKLYDSSSGGSALWGEVHSGLTVENGLLNLILGASTDGLAKVL